MGFADKIPIDTQKISLKTEVEAWKIDVFLFHQGLSKIEYL